MKLFQLKYPASIWLLFSALSLSAQSERAIQKNRVTEKNRIWNNAYNEPDSLRFYALFDKDAIVISAGGKWIGKEDCKRLCRFLHKIRPDIHWYNHETKIELGDDLKIAYETGKWEESWTEKNDTEKTDLKGKYWIMYVRNDDDNWYIHSAIFTPLFCKGSYCK